MFYVSWWWCASVARFHQIPFPVPRFFLQRYRSSLKTGPARPGHVKNAGDITHQRQQHIVTFRHLDDTIILLPFVYWKRYLWSRLAPPTNVVNWSKRSQRLFERSCGQTLTEANRTSRLKHARLLLKTFAKCAVDFISFTDEVFTVASPVNTQNARVYASSDMKKCSIAPNAFNVFEVSDGQCCYLKTQSH